MGFLGFGDKNKNNADAVQETQAQRRVTEGTLTAKWGATFRTCRFAMGTPPHATHDYLKANRMRDDTWTVFLIHVRPDDPEQEISTVNKVKAGLSLMDALDFLARFEMTEQPLSGQLVDPGEKKALGFEHYEAFGRREGFAFDESGFPHETLNGEICTEGQFKTVDIEALARDIKLPLPALTAAFSEAVMRGETPGFASLAPVTLNGAQLGTMKDVARMDNFIGQLNSARGQTRRFIAGATSNGHLTKAMDFLQSAASQIDEMGSNIDRDSLRRGVNIFKFYVSYTAVSSRFFDGDGYGGWLEKCQNILSRLGDPQAEKFGKGSSFLVNVSDDNFKIPDGFIEACVKLRADLAARAGMTGPELKP